MKQIDFFLAETQINCFLAPCPILNSKMTSAVEMALKPEQIIKKKLLHMTVRKKISCRLS